MVNYRPADLYAAGTYVALVLRANDLDTGDTRRMVLVDIVFHEHNAADTTTHRHATLVRKDMTRRLLLEDLKLQAYCKQVKQQCIVRINGKLLPLSNHLLFDMHHADYIRIDLPPHAKRSLSSKAIARCLRDGLSMAEAQRLFDQADTDFEWETVSINPPEGSDEVELLQRHMTRRQTAELVAHTQRPESMPVPICLDELIPAPSQTCIDFAAVQWTAIELGNIDLDLLQEWPDDLELESVTFDHLALLGPLSQQPPKAIHLYVDGSKNGGNVGAGVACFFEYTTHEALAGCMSKSVRPAQHAFVGEHAAMTWALIWAIHISDWCLSSFATNDIDISFNFDAMNTGYQAAGQWRTVDHRAWKTVMRSLAQVLERRHTQLRLHWKHIKAHTQHPRNELVDRLAKYAANHPDLVGTCDVWMPWITDGLHQHTLPWLWYFEHLQHQPHDAPRLDGTLMAAHSSPIASEDHRYFDHLDTAENQEAPEVISFDIVMATVNVLTLATEDNHGRITPTKQELLMRQFSEAGCHILGLQETRHKRIINPNNEFYHIVGHPCDSKGHDGVQMWFAKNKPLFLDGPYIQLKHLRIVHATPSLLIVKIDMPNWCSIFITGRAPHAGRPAPEGQQFWDQVSKNVRQYSHVMPIFFLGDTNAHLGSQTTQAVGPHHASNENQPGVVFHDWLLEHQLWIPSTFQAHQTGERCSTFSSPDGQHETRIDYVAIPLNIDYTEVHSWIDDTIDLGGARTDHVAALCHCRFETIGKLRQKQPMKGHPGPTRHAIAAQIRDPASATAFCQQLHNPIWNLDPHQSADHLARNAYHALQQITPKIHRWRRKHHVDESTWALVEEKKMLCRQFKALRKARSNTILQVMFSAWRSQTQDVPHHLYTAPATWMKMIDHAIATTTTQMQTAAKRASEAIRKADTQYYLSLAEHAGHAYTHEGLTAVWKQIKAVLPRNKLKQTQARHEMSDSLLHHFAELEAGTISNQAKSRQSCIDRNNKDLAAGPPSRQLMLEDLPTLVEIEDLCLKQRPNRAPGLDAIPPEVCRFAAKEIAPYIHNVILKSFLWGLEPVRYKGGQLCAIWKQKNSRKLASSYRGILLAEVFGKILHSWAQQRLLPTLVHRRAPGQIGGLPSQQTTTAIQLLKLHGRQGRHRHMTTAVIFVDLKAAFHHMLREYVFSIRDPLQQHELQRIFDSNEFNIDQLAADLQQACQEKPQDIPEALRLFLHDIHRSTWFQLDPDQDQVVTTDRGTRPGSPLADLGFNLLMSRIMHQLGDGLQLLHDYVQGCDQLGTHIPPISWVDDLAIPLATTAPHKMIPLIQDVVALLHTTFNAHGMTMNFETGKSEAVVMYRGKGANVCRTELFDSETMPCIVTATDTHILSLKVVAAYRHLGARFTMNADGEAEVTSRIAMARQSYQELKRAIFHNKHIPLKGRMQLYDSLIVARLMYACAVWTDISSSQLQQIEAVIIEHHRQMANKGFWNDTHMTDDDLRNHLEIPSFRVTWARHRLIYLQHLGKHAEGFHKQLLLTEFQQGRGWLCEVITDLQWLATLVALPFNIPAEVQEWQQVWDILKDLAHWKSMVKRACRKHVLQDRIARDVEQYHQVIVDEMNHAGFTMLTDIPMTDETLPPRFGCDQCDMVFNSAHARGSHAYRVHGTMSAERPYVQSTVCPGCLKDHHTTWRVQQHLKYRQNGCWDRIHGARQPGEPCTIVLPRHLQHVVRLPAVRRHYGPIRPTSVQRQRIQLRRRITALRHAGQEDYAWWYPERDPDLVHRACAAFSSGLTQWCNHAEPTNVEFHNIMFAKIFQLGVSDLLGGRIFVRWIETQFYDEWPSDLEPDLIDILEEAHMQMLEDIPAWQRRCEMKQLTDLWMHLPPDEPDIPPRLPPTMQKSRSRLHDVQMPYQMMGRSEQQRKQWKLLAAPRPRVPAGRGPYYIVHLYSGRRRSEDFHAAVEELLPRFPHLHIRILSIDTAVHSMLNVHDPKLWGFLVNLAREGRILGLLQGPPCETWTAARHQQSVDSDGRVLRGPRPLRSTQELWGLAQLSCKELEQIYVGNVLLLKGILLACLVTISGGATFLEHPAMPFQDEISSIWRLGLLCLLHRPPYGPFRRVSAEQWRFGSCGVKPTTFLYSNSNLPKALESCADATAIRPTAHLIGRNPDGTFKTAKAKEYPAQLNRAFAQAIFEAMTRWSMAPGDADAESFGIELAQTSASTECGPMLPDYQPCG